MRLIRIKMGDLPVADQSIVKTLKTLKILKINDIIYAVLFSVHGPGIGTGRYRNPHRSSRTDCDDWGNFR